MKLLREIKTSGTPDDYLFVRIRCRRAALDISGRGSWAGPGDPHMALRAEYSWVYAQLDSRLRRQLRPFFEYNALRTLIIVLRYLAAADQSAMRAQLQFSLLHPQLMNLLLRAKRVAPVVVSLERRLASEYVFFTGLAETYLRQGAGGLEKALLGGCLQQACARNPCPQLRELLIYLLDMRNLLALYKHLHWQLPTPPEVLTGGSLRRRLCKEIWTAHDLPRLLELMRKRSGQQGNPEASGVEEFLFQGVTIQLHRAGQDPLQAGLILDYLWHSLLAARNRGLRLSRAAALVETPLAKAVE